MAESLDVSTSAKPAPFSRRRRIVFRVVLVLFPFLFLACLEGGLRLAGFGGYPPIIRSVGPTEQGMLLITEPAGAASYFFANRKRPGYNEQYSFYQPKPPGTVRIVLVGESAMKGFPQPRNLAASAFLGEMLKDAWPDRKVEIINLGTTAIASFPVSEIMTEALDYEPDLVIVSTGHNEFYGTYGVASIGWAGSRPWMLRATRFIHSLAIAQAVEKLIPGRGPEQDKTLMELMVGRSYVAPDDWRRKAAARNLEYNVSVMIERCKARKVPVIICTQPCNERDLVPLGADVRTTQPDSGRHEEFSRLLNAGIEGLSRNPTNAWEQLKAALVLEPDHARAHFFLGKALFALGRPDQALEQFIRARDLDTMPWRAPSLSQEGILRAASRQGAVICDLVKVFREASPGGAIGWELMDDHVHPTVQGQALAARALVDCLTRMDGRLSVSREAYGRLAGAEVYAGRLGDNPFDRYAVAHMMRVIFNIPFMRETNPQAFARFDALANQIESNYPPDIQVVMREYQTATPHAGGKRPLTGMVARVLIRQKKYAEALELLRIAQKGVPDYTSWHMEYVYFALDCQQKLHGSLTGEEKAVAMEEIKQGRFLLQHGFSTSGLAERYLGRLHQLRGEFAEAIPYLLASRTKLNGMDLVAADEALVVSYLKTGQAEKAGQVAENGIQHSGPYASLYRQMAAELSALTKTNHSAGAEQKPDSN
jgi:tetratricopeptide (TPR) repeat protein